MLGVGTHSYKYDGLGNRIQQTVSSTVTDYLLDLQPGLARVLVADDGSDTYRYVHSPRAPQTTAGFPAVSIHAQELDNGSTQTWSHMLTDGLGSVRGTLSDALAVTDQTDYTPFGEQQSSLGTNFAFTGELLDANGLQHHRARYYNPALLVLGITYLLAVFVRLDVVEPRRAILCRSTNSPAAELASVSWLPPVTHFSSNCSFRCGELLTDCPTLT